MRYRFVARARVIEGLPGLRLCRRPASVAPGLPCADGADDEQDEGGRGRDECGGVHRSFQKKTIDPMAAPDRSQMMMVSRLPPICSASRNEGEDRGEGDHEIRGEQVEVFFEVHCFSPVLLVRWRAAWMRCQMSLGGVDQTRRWALVAGVAWSWMGAGLCSVTGGAPAGRRFAFERRCGRQRQPIASGRRGLLPRPTADGRSLR
ncbi:MAG: hypothetical protein K2Y29_17975 [Beijerinckiaceae bacterium]|nr:hypothetical protein [Beijerinckiaceae bacterium]